MTRVEFDALFDRFIIDLKKIHGTKGIEYFNADDHLANFKREGLKLGVSPEIVCYIYGEKHLDAIAHYVRQIQYTGKTPETTSEPIDGRFHDAVNYLVLLFALVVERTRDEAKIPSRKPLLPAP